MDIGHMALDPGMQVTDHIIVIARQPHLVKTQRRCERSDTPVGFPLIASARSCSRPTGMMVETRYHHLRMEVS